MLFSQKNFEKKFEKKKREESYMASFNTYKL
jgi:hypothetical protein